MVIITEPKPCWDFSLPDLHWLSLLLPLPEVHSDETQSVCSPIASSAEAFQLLQRDLTKISCSLLNYNLPSTSLSFSSCLTKNWPPSLFCCQLICVFVCARHMHVCVKLPQLPVDGVLEMIGGARIWSGSVGRSRAKASTFCSLLFFSSISLFLPVIMTSCLLHSFLLSLFPNVASVSFTVVSPPALSLEETQVSIYLHCHHC